MADKDDKKPAKEKKEPKEKKVKEEKFKTRYVGTVTVGDKVFETEKLFKKEKDAHKGAVDIAVKRGVIGSKEVKVRSKSVEERVD